MTTIAFEQGIALREISSDLYESIERPWTWYKSQIVPGGILMALAAAAAYRTVLDGFELDMLHAHFLSGPTPEHPMQLRVQRLSDGGRFATRAITLEQGKKPMVHVTCSFARASSLGGPSMQHRVARATTETIDNITLDDLEPGRNRQGPYMKFQRLSVSHRDGVTASSAAPQDKIYTSAALISPPITTHAAQTHLLGIVALSDYHVLDAAPTLHGLTFGLSRIGDSTRTPTRSHIERYTTLNHTVRFHTHQGFRADRLCYIEVTSPWAGEKRAEIQSRMFDEEGQLIASCVQEAFYVLKEPREGKL